MISIVAYDVHQRLVNPALDGVFLGSAYGLVALGITLVYRGSRIFNVAQGELGTVAALVTFGLVGNGFGALGGGAHLPYGLAALIGIAAAVVLALLVERLVIRPLARRPKVTGVVATAGVTLLLVGVEQLVFGQQPLVLRPLTFAAPPLKQLGTGADAYYFTWQQFAILLTLVALALVATVFFRYSRLGLAITGAAQEPTAARLVGISVARVSSLNWAFAGFLGGVAGVLLAAYPGFSFSPGFMTLTVLIPGFTAAVLGGITSLAGAFVGGIAIGLIQQIAGTYTSAFPGAPDVAVAAVLLLVLLVRPHGLLGRSA